MAPQTRSRGSAPASSSKVYHKSKPAPKQAKFPDRLTTVKTYSRKSLPSSFASRRLAQSTLTQIGYVTHMDPDDMDRTIGLEDLEGHEHEKEMAPPPKRRRTIGDVPNSTASSSFHTQTLTQFYSERAKEDEEDESVELVIKDSDDEEEDFDDDNVEMGDDGAKLAKESADVSPPKKPSRAALLIPQTPNKPIRTEIPSSQPSPFTPYFGSRYTSPVVPHRSLPKGMSTNSKVPSSAAESRNSTERPKRKFEFEIADSYSTVNGGFSSSPSKSSTERTPSKVLLTNSNVSLDIGLQKEDEDDGMNVTDVSVDLAMSVAGKDDSRAGTEAHEQSSKSSKRQDDTVISDSEDDESDLTPTKDGGADFLDDDTSTPVQRSMFGELVASTVEDGNVGILASSGRVSAIQASKQDSQRQATPERPGLGDEVKPETPPPERVVDQPAEELVPASVPIPTTQASERASQRHATPEPPCENDEDATPELPYENDEVEVEKSPLSRMNVSQISRLATQHLATPEHSNKSNEVEPHKTPLVQVMVSQTVTQRKAIVEISDEPEDIEPETPDTSSQRRRNVSIAAEIGKESSLSSPQMTSPVHDSQTEASKSQWNSQLESQRVPMDVIRSLGPQTDRSDVILSIGHPDVKQIVDGIKDHEFRNYNFPPTVSRIWIYITEPVCHLKYMAVIGPVRKPGEIDDESGLGNAEFNLGKGLKFAYELKQVYQLNNPVSIARMKDNGWVDRAPSKYVFVPPAVLGELLGNLRWALFEGHPTQVSGAYSSVSQELEMNLRTDLLHSTQFPTPSSPGHEVLAIPSSQDEEQHIPPRATQVGSSTDKSEMFSKPSLPQARPDLPAPAPAARHQSPGQGSLRRSQRFAVRPSQATTASAASTQFETQKSVISLPSPTQYPNLETQKSVVSRPQPCSSDDLPSYPEDMTLDDSPLMFSKWQSTTGVESSQAFLFHDNLIYDSRVREPPPPEIWDSEGDDGD